jgi:hypothetical protein
VGRGRFGLESAPNHELRPFDLMPRSLTPAFRGCTLDSVRDEGVPEESLGKSQEELAETRAKLASAEHERDLALKRLQIEEGRCAEVRERNEKLLDLYMETSKLAERRQAEADEFRKLWEQSCELAERQANDLIQLQASVKELTARIEKFCSLCGTDGPLYVFEGKRYCTSCLAKRRPPLPHRGPERRKSQRPGLWRRRATDHPERTP